MAAHSGIPISFFSGECFSTILYLFYNFFILSGVGPRDHLDTIGIPVQKHLPGVGSHLVCLFHIIKKTGILNFGTIIQQDHFGVPVVYQCPMADSLLCLEQRPITFIREFIHYMLYGTGLLLSPVLELSIFAKADRLDTESKVTLPAQSDARDTENLPDIEIIPVSHKWIYQCVSSLSPPFTMFDQIDSLRRNGKTL